MQKSNASNLKRVFVWELPVRIYHWVNALVLVVLVATGFWIANPPAIQSSDEASLRYLMGWVRHIHFVSAYIFVFNFIFRLYWGFVGNRYASWKSFIPTNIHFFERIWSVLKVDILMIKDKRKGYHTAGHNAMAGLVYFGMFFVFMVSIVTGFGLYADMSTWFLPQMFDWVPHMFGGDAQVRHIHHVATWVTILFTVVHVYLVMYHDYVEGNGEVSSMFGGWKFMSEGYVEHTKEQQKNKKKKKELV